MSIKKYVSLERLANYDALIKQEIVNSVSGKADSGHSHDERYYTENEIDLKIDNINESISNITNGSVTVAKAIKATSADTATTANHSASSDSATTATSATKDSNGNTITSTYETKTDASAKLASAKTYTDNVAENVKNDLLNGAGGAYDTLKELGDLIDENTDAIDALEAVAAGKADKVHTHTVSNISDLTATATELNYVDGVTSNIQTQLNGKLGKTTYEYNAELALGSTGKVCIGKFPMYDSNISVEIKSTTNTTYNGTLIIATQNINTTGGGSYTVTVYGDASNSLTDSIKIHYGSGSNVFSVYIDLPSWSKNLLHIQCVSLAGTPTDIATTVSSIPSNATIVPTNALKTQLDGKANAGHTHNYAGSSSAGGAAYSALACTGNASTATTLENTRYIDGVSFDGSANATRYAVCNTASGAAAKTATITNGSFSLIAGARVTVKFAYGFCCTNPTLNIGGTGAKLICLHSRALTLNDTYNDNAILDLVYDGSVWEIVDSSQDAGNATVPIYISRGKPTACTYTLGKSVPSNAVFTDTTYSAATQSAAGLMSAADKKKLDGVAAGANNYTYTLPAATSSALGGVKIGDNISNSSGTISLTKENVTSALGYTPPTTNTTYSAATASAAGLMSAADKTKLDNIPAVIAFYGVALTFSNNQATYSDSRIKANSVVVCSRRAGSKQSDIFSVNPAAGSVTISSTATTSGTINVNIIVINN